MPHAFAGHRWRADVSIHAPRFREAMPCTVLMSAPDSSFNPRPPFPGGDARIEPDVDDSLEVSIHAPRFREAMQAAAMSRRAALTFQSTPPVSGRRCKTRSPLVTGLRSFNPRPPFPGGDAHQPAEPHVRIAVSIHAPRFREAMLANGCRVVVRPLVSIHAPRFREAMPMPAQVIDLAKWFQSTPPVSGRRCRAGCRRLTRHWSFNPRPPFPGGDAPRGWSWVDPTKVSIHAPRFREAMLGAWLYAMLTSVVSIHAPRFREAMPLLWRQSQLAPTVSIHAPRFREAMRTAPVPWR